MTIDQAHPCGERVDAEALEGQVGEGHTRQDDGRHPGVATQQFHGAFSDHGRARDRVDDSALSLCRTDEGLDNARVHFVEAFCRLVEVVEAAPAHHSDSRGVPGGAQPPHRGSLDRGEHLGRDQARPTWAEAHHGDPGRRRHWVKPGSRPPGPCL